MKNLHLLPTDKPSRLFYLASNLHLEQGQLISPKNYQNIYITSDEEIKEGDWFYNPATKEALYSSKEMLSWNCDTTQEHKGWKKIILTTDQDLIKDGVQSIDDEFLEWFVHNPSCEEVEVSMENYYASGALQPNLWQYKIIIPKEEPKQETLEEAAENKYGLSNQYSKNRIGFIEGAKWQAERMYNEEEVMNILINSLHSVELKDNKNYFKIYNGMKEWFEQFKKKV